jgi:hypothetical protein
MGGMRLRLVDDRRAVMSCEFAAWVPFTAGAGFRLHRGRVHRRIRRLDFSSVDGAGKTRAASKPGAMPRGEIETDALTNIPASELRPQLATSLGANPGLYRSGA